MATANGSMGPESDIKRDCFDKEKVARSEKKVVEKRCRVLYRGVMSSWEIGRAHV